MPGAKKARRINPSGEKSRMLSLAYRVLSMPAIFPEHLLTSSVLSECQKIAKYQSQLVAKAVLVDLSNVENYYSTSPQERWVIEDFPNVLIPFHSSFLEWNNSKIRLIDGKWKAVLQVGEWSQFGFLCNLIDLVKNREEFDSQLHESKARGVTPLSVCRRTDKIRFDNCVAVSRFLNCLSFWSSSNRRPVFGQPMYWPVFCFVFSDCQGRFTDLFRCVFNLSSETESSWERLMPVFDEGLHIFGLSASFLHCKNVKIQTGNSDNFPPDKWLRQKQLPKVEYKTLVIDPMKTVLESEGGSKTVGLKKALHICRGHFATYTEKAPLFGRVVGTVWKPQHTRGSASSGRVEKDYSIAAPGEAKKTRREPGS